jgi:predicted molibdopterin-dependent oxidoreductase YjgC
MVKIPCNCGALYAVTTHRAPFGYTGVTKCVLCGAILDKCEDAVVYEIYELAQQQEAGSAVEDDLLPASTPNAPTGRKIARKPRAHWQRRM